MTLFRELKLTFLYCTLYTKRSFSRLPDMLRISVRISFHRVNKSINLSRSSLRRWSLRSIQQRLSFNKHGLNTGRSNVNHPTQVFTIFLHCFFVRRSMLMRSVHESLVQPLVISRNTERHDLPSPHSAINDVCHKKRCVLCFHTQTDQITELEHCFRPSGKYNNAEIRH